jgi:hypothetical protein
VEKYHQSIISVDLHMTAITAFQHTWQNLAAKLSWEEESNTSDTWNLPIASYITYLTSWDADPTQGTFWKNKLSAET